MSQGLLRSRGVAEELGVTNEPGVVAEKLWFTYEPGVFADELGVTNEPRCSRGAGGY